MLMGVQLGGGTDINKAVAYCQEHISDPAKTLFILITDLMEGGVEAQLVRRMGEIQASGVRTLCLLALSDSGIPYYDERVATKLAKLGVPCFGCTPSKLPELVHGGARRRRSGRAGQARAHQVEESRQPPLAKFRSVLNEIAARQCGLQPRETLGAQFRPAHVELLQRLHPGQGLDAGIAHGRVLQPQFLQLREVPTGV